MARMNTDIMGVSDVRWPEDGNLWNEDYRFIFSGTWQENPGRGGIGIMLRKDIGNKA